MGKIVNDKIVLIWRRRIKSYYINLGYHFTELGNKFTVFAKHLSRSSNVLIKVECDICKKQREMKRIAFYGQNCQSCAKKNEWQNPEYRNKKSGKNGAMYGKTHSKETREKIRKGNIGNKNCLGRVASEETKAKMKGKNNPCWKPDLTDEDRKARSFIA